MPQLKAEVVLSTVLLIVLLLWIVVVQRLLKAQLSSLTSKQLSIFSIPLRGTCKCNSWKWLWWQTGKLWVWSDWVTQGLSYSAAQSRHAEITHDRIYILPTLLCLKIFKYKVCTGFFSMQCHWLQCRNWFRAQPIPAELWDRHLFPLQLSLFIVFKRWQVSPQEPSCLAENVCQHFTQNLLVILITETGRRVWASIPTGISAAQNTVYNKQHLVSDLQQYAPLGTSVYFTHTEAPSGTVVPQE